MQVKAKTYRGFRGGSWLSSPRILRLTNHIRLTPVNRNNNLGFRLVKLTKDKKYEN